MTDRSLYCTIAIICSFLVFCIIPAMAVDTFRNIPPSEIAMTEFYYPDNVVSHIYHGDITPQWIRDDLFWYTDRGRRTTDYILCNTTTQKKTLLCDTVRFASSLSSASGKPVDPAHMPVTITAIAPDLDSFTCTAFGSIWTCNLSDYRITEDMLPGPVNAGIRSPDMHYIAYVEKNDLSLYDTKNGMSSRLTTDGTDDYFYAMRSETVSYPVTEERLGEYPVPYLVWSPDSTKVRTFHVDQRKVNETWLVQDVPENNTIKPVLYSYRFACPGDAAIPQYEPVVINILTGTVTRVAGDPQPEVSMMDTEEYLLQWWDETSDTIWSLGIERGEKTISLNREDPHTGSVTRLITETGATYRETNLAYASRPNIAVTVSGDIIWFSERDGWGHLYRYDASGTLKNQITKGEWVVRELLGIDENRQLIYFTASGREEGNPYYHYLYRIRTDGTGLQVLTPENGDHEISLSPDTKTFVDSVSRVDLPTITRLCSADGNRLMHLATADISDLTALLWEPPEQVSYKARDKSTDLYGLLFTPPDFDPKGLYPVIDIVYPGPYTTITCSSFPDDLSWNAKIFWTGQMLAELGYVVLTTDGLGTAYRSKPFHDVSYGHLSDCGLPDHITGLEQLKKTHPYLDLSRVGIYGKSAGGFMAAQAMLTYLRFFSVGVAACGNYDSRLYASFWGEKYEGMPNGNNYEEQVTKEKAANLSGDLLLMTGDLDDNVHPAMTLQLADALIQEGKIFDLVILTNENHNVNYEPYYLRRMIQFFVNNL